MNHSRLRRVALVALAGAGTFSGAVILGSDLMVGSSTELVKRVGALRAGARSNPGASTPS